MAQDRTLPDVEQLSRSRVQVGAGDAGGNERPGYDPLALAAGGQDAAGPLLGAEAAEEIVAANAVGPLYPPAGPLRCLDDHVHAVGIGGVIAEVNDHLAAHRAALDAKELAVARGRFRFGAESSQIIRKP